MLCVWGWVSLAAVSVLMDGKDACRILCVSSSPAYERHCLTEVHRWQMSNLPPRSPTHSPVPSWSIFLFCLPAQRTCSPFKSSTGKTYRADIIKALFCLCAMLLDKFSFSMTSSEAFPTTVSHYYSVLFCTSLDAYLHWAGKFELQNECVWSWSLIGQKLCQFRKGKELVVAWWSCHGRMAAQEIR